MPNRSPDLTTPGGRLRFLREAKEMSQTTLAEKVFTSQPAISQWEKNKWLPSKQTQVLLAEALGTTRAFLFDDDASKAAA